MIELFVAATCLGDYRCDMAYKAYISSNPPIKRWSYGRAKEAEKLVGKQTVVALTLSTAALTNKPYQVRLGRQVSIGRSPDGFILLYAFSF